MKELEMKKVDAIFTADWHIRNDTPVCRTDDFLKAMYNKIMYILSIQDKYKCPIFVAGDVFNKPRRLSKRDDNFWIDVFKQATNDIIIIPGNHDLPDHNINEYSDSSLAILENAIDNVVVYKTILETIATVGTGNTRNIGMIHKMIHRDNPLKVNDKCISKKAAAVLRANSKYDIIISGDNHETFVEEYENRILVNPGSLMRTTAAQIDHKPCIFLYEESSNTVEQHFLPIKKEVVSRDHIDKEKEEDERMQSYVSKMRDDVEMTLSYKNNMKEELMVNKISEKTKEYVWGSFDVK